MRPFGIHEASSSFFNVCIYLSGAVLALARCAGFAAVVESGGCSSLQCEGSLRWWLLSLKSMGSGPCGLGSCGTWASLIHGMGDLPGPRIEPVSPPLAGGFFTTELPGKPIPEASSLSIKVGLEGAGPGFLSL